MAGYAIVGDAMVGVTAEGAPAGDGGADSAEASASAAATAASAAELVEDSFDVIVSNCVINLSPDKAAVLSNAYRLLRPGKSNEGSLSFCY